MSTEYQRPISASAAVPGIYKIILTTIEPIFAMLGAVMTLNAPHQYLAGVTRNAHPFEPNTRFLFTQLGGSWLFFAFVEGVVLRLFDDLNLWRVVCAGMLLSDIGHSHSMAQAVGGWGSWTNRSEWTVEDYVIFWSSLPFLLVRILIVLGIGIKTKRTAKESKAE